jgi:hypothetical protein
VVLFGGQVERLKTQLELTLAVKGWLKLVLDISWAWISLSVIRAVSKPPGSYWVIVNRVMQASVPIYSHPLAPTMKLGPILLCHNPSSRKGQYYTVPKRIHSYISGHPSSSSASSPLISTKRLSLTVSLRISWGSKP